MEFTVETLPDEETIVTKCNEKGTYTAFGLCRIKPTNCILPGLYPTALQKILDFPVRDDDVFLISSPKCGTTWSMEMVWMIGNGMDFEKAKISQFKRFPHFDIDGCIEKAKLDQFGGSCIDFLNSQTDQRYIKSHLPKDLLPRQIWKKKVKVIFVVRNGKDAAVSNYHQYRIFHRYTGTLDEFLEATLDEKIIYSPFWEHAIEFWKIKDEPNILFLTYEEMKKDLPKTIRKTAEFLGKAVSDKDIALLQKHLSIENMRNNPAVNYEDVKKRMEDSDGIAIEGNFMRSGTVGGAEKDMSPELSKRFEEWTRSKIAGTGLDELYPC